VGDAIAAQNGAWTFDGISTTFDDHVRKSVPMYRESHELIARTSDHFLPDDSHCYDLGCSTGELLRMLADRHAHKSVTFTGLDVEPSMVDAARNKCEPFPSVEVVQGDMVELDLAPSEMIVSQYAMQFVRPRDRQCVFDRIYASLAWGGAFFLFEKVRGPDARFQDILTSVYTEYKIEQGYQADEIVAKARSLKGVLEPFSTAGNLGLLERAGFVDIATIFKYACFEGFLAIK
jgi:tRNA (cmo5U34)-methyltransferase